MSLDRLTTRSTAGELYVRALSTAYRSGFRVWDPDYALSQDPDAWEKVRRDAVIAGAVTYRKHLVAGRQWLIAPATEDGGADERLAQAVEELFRQIDDFDGSRLNLTEAVFRGSHYALLEGRMRVMDIAGLGPRPWWVPVRLRDVPKDRVRFTTSDPDAQGRLRVGRELWSVARMRWEPLDPRQPLVRVVYHDDESSLGHGRGLLEAIYFYSWSKAQLLQYGLDGAESWAKGILVAKIDGFRLGDTNKANAAVLQDWLDVVAQVRSRHGLALGKEDDLSLLTGGGEGHQIVSDLLAYHDEALRTLIVGANLPTSATKGGSFALAEVQENSTEALVQYDRRIQAAALTRDAVRFVVRANRPALAALGLARARDPSFGVVQEQFEDPDKAVAQLVSLRRDAQVPVTIEEAYRKIGWTPPRPDEPVLEPLAQPAPGPAPDGGAFGALRDEVREIRALVLAGRNGDGAALARPAGPEVTVRQEIESAPLSLAPEAVEALTAAQARAAEAVGARFEAVAGRLADAAAADRAALARDLVAAHERAASAAAAGRAEERGALARDLAAAQDRLGASLADAVRGITVKATFAPTFTPRIVLAVERFEATLRMPARKVTLTTADGRTLEGEARDAR